jgi:hypothetical protein
MKEKDGLTAEGRKCLLEATEAVQFLQRERLAGIVALEPEHALSVYEALKRAAWAVELTNKFLDDGRQVMRYFGPM